MQDAITFCFNPTQEAYDKIIKSGISPLHFDTWNTTVAYTFGWTEIDEIEDWVTDEKVLRVDPYANEKHEYINDDAIKLANLKTLKAAFEPLEESIREKYDYDTAVKYMSIYCVDGSLHFLDRFYQIMQHPDIDANDRIKLRALFDKVKALFVAKVAKPDFGKKIHTWTSERICGFPALCGSR